jgi:uncharacterized protein with PIN domain
MKTCNECGEPVVLTEGEELKGIGIITASVAEGNTCRKCLMQGWSEATPQDFINDPAFAVGYLSPIQRKDI